MAKAKPPSSSPVDPEVYLQLARLAVAASKRELTSQERAQRDWFATVAKAQEIVAERERDTKATAAAIIRAGKKRRNEE